MCWSEKCCFFIPLKHACILLGVISFITSTGMTVASITYYFSERTMADLQEQPHFVAKFLGLDIKMGTVNIILSIVVIVCIFWMIFSILLVAGVLKNEPSLVLSYFSFGIMLTILCQLSALLLLLNKCWMMALAIFICSLLNIHFLVVVHTVYELMQKGRDFRFHRHYDQDEDVDPITECFEDNIDNIDV